MKKIFLLTCLIAVVLYRPKAQSGDSVSDVKVLADTGQSFEERKAGILKRWAEMRPACTEDSFYDILPSYKAPYEAGKLKDSCLKDALNMLNFYRYLTGLPDDGELKDEFIELAQHGSLLNAAHRAIAHQLSRPADMSVAFYTKASRGIGSSNLGQGNDSLTNGVTGWMDDSDRSNFLPQGVSEYSGTYRVEIAGLKTIAGRPVNLKYETTFFPLEVPSGPGDFKTATNGDGTLTITGYTGRMQNWVIPRELNNRVVTAIGENAFTYSEISSITLPDSIKTIASHFLWYSKINSIINSIAIPRSVTTIGDQAFSCCPNLVSVTIPPGLTTIGNFAFMDCKSLTTVTIPPGTVKVGYGAFKGCDNLDPALRSELAACFGNNIFP